MENFDDRLLEYNSVPDKINHLSYRLESLLPETLVYCADCGTVAHSYRGYDATDVVDWETIASCQNCGAADFILETDDTARLALANRLMNLVAGDGGMDTNICSMWYQNASSEHQHLSADRDEPKLWEFDDSAEAITPERTADGPAELDGSSEDAMIHRYCCRCERFQVCFDDGTGVQYQKDENIEEQLAGNDDTYHWSQVPCTLPRGLGRCNHTPCGRCYVTSSHLPGLKQTILSLGGYGGPETVEQLRKAGLSIATTRIRREEAAVFRQYIDAAV